LNKVGYIISIVGGILAVVFSMLLIITGPVFFAGDDVYHFISDNSNYMSDNSNNLGKMWVDIGNYYKIDPFLKNNLGDYISGYTDALQNLSARDLEEMSTKYDMDAFHDLAGIYNKFEGYLPKLEIGFMVCLVASVAALAGAELARKFRVAGGATVLSAAALTLIFSLIASSIIPMAAASLLLMLGGLLQMAKPRADVTIHSQEIADSGGGMS
jgi:hypothetical protein